jgi:hypothetical protein
VFALQRFRSIGVAATPITAPTPSTPNNTPYPTEPSFSTDDEADGSSAHNAEAGKANSAERRMIRRTIGPDRM